MSNLINFLCLVRQRREDLKLEDNIYIACDEIAIWYDAISKSTVEEKVVKKYPFARHDIPIIVWICCWLQRVMVPSVKATHSLIKETTCARVGTEIWKQSSIGISRHELDESGYYGRPSQPCYCYQGRLRGRQCLLHIDCLCGTTSSVMLARTQKIVLKSWK